MSGILRRQLRADALKARSAPTLLTLSSLVIVTPLLVLFMTGIVDGLPGIDDRVATASVLSVGVAGSLGCAFYGSYLVTRDDYYRAMERSFLMAPARIVYVSRILVAGLVGLGFSAVGFLIWVAVTAVILEQHGRALAVGPEIASLAWGNITAGALAAVIGCSVGWLVRNYYVSVVVLLILPALIATPMLGRLRDIERFLPVGAVAGLGGVPLEGLLSQGLSGFILACWAALAALVGWLSLRRRMQA